MQSLETKSSRPRPKSFDTETETRPETFETETRKRGLETCLETEASLETLSLVFDMENINSVHVWYAGGVVATSLVALR